MFSIKTIADQQIGLLSNRTGFEAVLESGRHYVSSAKTLELCNLTQFPAVLPNLEWLAANHAAILAPHLDIVQTAIDEVAMVCSGQKRHFVLPNSLQAFWKKGSQLEVLRTRLDKRMAVPAQWVERLPVNAASGYVKQVSVPAGAFALLFVDDEFCDYLAPGRHAYFDVLPKTRLTQLRESQVINNQDMIHAMLAVEHGEVGRQFKLVTTSDNQLAAWWYQDALIAVTGPADRALGGNALRHEIVDLAAAPQPVASHIVLALRRGRETAALATDHVFQCEIPSEHVGLLHVDGVFSDVLQPGFYNYWHGGKRLSLTTVDSRLSVVEISGQEMLTQDKVPLRVNVTAGYKIVDARNVTSSLNDYKDFIYKEIQFALRAAIGAKTLDGLLENKNATDEQILGYVREKTAVHGIEIVSVGIKDLILPGEIKTLLSKVVEAEKAAQANVIRRREETAATRSLANTSRVMEDNPVALRLKELETLEKITEKIGSISVYGGLESVLKQIAAFKPAGVIDER